MDPALIVTIIDLGDDGNPQTYSGRGDARVSTYFYWELTFLAHVFKACMKVAYTQISKSFVVPSVSMFTKLSCARDVLGSHGRVKTEDGRWVCMIYPALQRWRYQYSSSIDHENPTSLCVQLSRVIYILRDCIASLVQLWFSVVHNFGCLLHIPLGPLDMEPEVLVAATTRPGRAELSRRNFETEVLIELFRPPSYPSPALPRNGSEGCRSEGRFLVR